RSTELASLNAFRHARLWISCHFQKNLFQRPSHRINAYNLTAQAPDSFEGCALVVSWHGKAYDSIPGHCTMKLRCGNAAHYNFSLLTSLKKIRCPAHAHQP